MHPKILRLVFIISDVAQRRKLRIQQRNNFLTADKNFLTAKEILALKRRHKIKYRIHMGVLGCHYCVQWKVVYQSTTLEWMWKRVV